MNEINWFEKELFFGKPIEMLPYSQNKFYNEHTH
jgi:hypothetical protein